MDINGLSRTATTPSGTPLSAAALPDTSKPSLQAEAETPQISRTTTAPEPAFTRPVPTERVTKVEPPTSGSNWDKTLEGALNQLPDARSWQALAGGLGQISQYRSIEQNATTRLTPRTEGNTEPQVISRSSLGGMSFSATLASGTKVTFSINAHSGLEKSSENLVAFRSMDVQFWSDAELTEEEQAELQTLSKNLGTFATNFAAGGEPDISHLNLSQLTEIESIQLSLKTADQKTLSLDYSRNTLGTEFNLAWNGRSLNLAIQPGESNQQDLSRLRETLLEYLDKGRAESSDTKALLNALSLFNVSNNQAPSAQPEKGSALLTGLPDYQLDFKGKVDYPSRRNEHHDKYSGIRLLSIGQVTHTETENGTTSITQTQNIDLEAAYFTSLPHLENIDLARENFKWHKVDESIQIVSQQTWKNEKIDNASIQRLTSIQNSQQTWSEGNLIDEQRDERQSIDTVDAIRLLTNASASTDLASKKQAKAELIALLNPLTEATDLNSA
ncbi:hypothetical protein [Gilvimarinus xylanilyticus]|uniref:Uncharacterized protein n=1 Tax=Gilvimarinus xylanilyticus TaxID=2944139 RepID=A0A9X2I0X6_9GAMM|nr:hypothetical protein [Gilvimarinus xylanilyticus]MCP8898310.1 hypothetical protein [Gilvimarinus xylanilyticus]